MRAVAPISRALCIGIALLAAIDIFFYITFPHFERLRYNFSSTYLAREVRGLRNVRPIVVLGDSVMWGYGLQQERTAIGILHANDPSWHNLAYAGGSPPNTLAMFRYLLREGVRPREIVFNVNQKEFNVEDSAYQRLHPALEDLAWNDLPSRERAKLSPVLSQNPDARIDRFLSRIWQLYGMRPDIRDALFGEADAAHRLSDEVEQLSGATYETDMEHRPTPDKFEGTYDLTPVAAGNVGFDALVATAALARRQGIPMVAILTPTNHRLLHAYIDVPEYRHNLLATQRALEGRGVRVLNFDANFPSNEFIDNDHLTAKGNAHLATLLAQTLR